MEITISTDIIKILTLFAMFYMHIKDDFSQGIMASMKQSRWWKENYPQDMYKNDYKIVVVLHSVKWSISILIFPVLYYISLGDGSKWVIVIAFYLNATIHAFIDNLKANKLIINLIQDQFVHFVQIFITWLLLVIIL